MKSIFNKSFMVALITILLVISTAQLSNAQFKKGDNLVNIGVGVNSYYSSGMPIGASYEYGITDAISVGASVDYLSTSYGWSQSGLTGSEDFTAFYIGARGSYHFNELFNLNIEKLDLYGGVSLGFRSFAWKDSRINSSDNGLGSEYGNAAYVGVFAGGKYYFTEHFGGFVELGEIGSTNARIGITFKF